MKNLSSIFLILLIILFFYIFYKQTEENQNNYYINQIYNSKLSPNSTQQLSGIDNKIQEIIKNRQEVKTFDFNKIGKIPNKNGEFYSSNYDYNKLELVGFKEQFTDLDFKTKTEEEALASLNKDAQEDKPKSQENTSQESQENDQINQKKNTIFAPHETDTSEIKATNDIFSSPSLGFDYSTKLKQIKLLTCNNQDECLQPHLQLKQKFKIYLCSHPVPHGVRFYFLAKEGLLMHPMVDLLTNDKGNTPDEADFIFYLPGSAPWHKSECNNTAYREKLVIIDEFDGPNGFNLPEESYHAIAKQPNKYPSWENKFYFATFKRSYVNKNDGELVGFPHIRKNNYYPMVYSLGSTYYQKKYILSKEDINYYLTELEKEKLSLGSSLTEDIKKDYDYYIDYLNKLNLNGKAFQFPKTKSLQSLPLSQSEKEALYTDNLIYLNRYTDLLCTLRGDPKHMTSRYRAQNLTKKYAELRKIENYSSGQLNTATRTQMNAMYFFAMYQSKIIITINPARWEGDFRLWESLASGALIFVDPIFVPHPFNLVDGEHVVYYNSKNENEFFEKVDYYMANPNEARRIALGGYFHALKHHRSVSMIDYFIRTLHFQKLHEELNLNEFVGNRFTKPGETLADYAKELNYTFTGQFLTSELKQQLPNIMKCKLPGKYFANKEDQVRNRLVC